MSDGDDRLSPLRSIPLFGDLDDDALGRILEVATPFEVHRGHVLIQPNQAGEGMFVIERGRVTVELPSGPVEVGAGEFVGELALLDENAVHTGRVLAAEEVHGLAIRRDDFETLLESQPKIALAMLRVLARRLAQSVRR
ncbi:MAG TPA: Crp/Fnr family transcriptional regulator [Actinomycetota bacterium]|jgi:voltage-gated potassium channel|nr:Crp/Fnr family transcriptional regulator [Actinomycetota bacterium]